jgi:assimilatory nitrate reductase catalytic subunit
VARLQEIAGEPLAEIHPVTARRYGLGDGDRAWLSTRRNAASFKVKLSTDIREDTIFVPFHWGGSQSANRLTNPALDPISRMPEFKVCAVHVTPWTDPGRGRW